MFLSIDFSYLYDYRLVVISYNWLYVPSTVNLEIAISNIADHFARIQSNDLNLNIFHPSLSLVIFDSMLLVLCTMFISMRDIVQVSYHWEYAKS